MLPSLVSTSVVSLMFTFKLYMNTICTSSVLQDKCCFTKDQTSVTAVYNTSCSIYCMILKPILTSNLSDTADWSAALHI